MSTALTLYEIHDELAAWSNTLELAETDQERAEIEARISEWLQAGRDKVDSFNAFLSSLEAQAELAKKEVDRINAIRRRIEGLQERLEGYALRTMEALGVRKLEGNTSSLALRLKPGSVIVENENLVPREFMEACIFFPAHYLESVLEVLPKDTRANLSIRKADIAKAIKAGEDVPGCTLSLGGNSLVRK